MTNQSIFFNPGDAIASTHDFKEARRSAEIFKAKTDANNKLVIAQNDKNGEFTIYYADKVADKAHGIPHHLKDEI
ncbi:hypothetical protein [Lactobacillus sp. PV034]|uniref:hypothetical protein n=1 Tax=Lactobacillus sp. PV034 TaxID=2594495 RepID=UPI00223F67E2|nr:hypothetical protein [Lactobacillus sp. PV034]QNQ81047.1 hypothetical protein FP432_05500 [Lactobacillus sp. PV034]